jgi:hypothetical protein
MEAEDESTEGTPLALLLQDIENWALQSILPLLKEFEPCVLAFDGLMTRKKVTTAAAERCCEAIEQQICFGN